MIGGIRILSRRYGGAYAYHPSSTRNLISTSTYCRTICNNNNNNNNNNKPLILSATDTATDNATDTFRYYPLSWSTLTLTPLIGGDPHKYRQRRWINTDSSSNNNNNNTNDASPTYTPLPSSSRKKQKKGKMKNKKQRGRKSYRFVDRTRIQLSGGAGGRGCTSMFHIGRKRKKKPDGGHGGNGGSILIIADPVEQSLRWTRPHVTAEAGAAGGSNAKYGRNGKNTIIRVPCGVVVRRILEHDEYFDNETKTVHTLSVPVSSGIDGGAVDVDIVDNPSNALREKRKNDNHDSFEVSNHKKAGGYLASNDYDSDDDEDDDYDENSNNSNNNDFNHDNNNEFYHYTDDNTHDEMKPNMSTFTAWGEKEKVEIADLDKPGSYVVIAKGGRGGYGNMTFASSNEPMPPPEVIAEYAEPDLGESCRIELELKLIADIGLVGFPNAGKSSLLSATSRATPYIAPYPFTTLNPLVGYIEYRDGFRVCAADVPGLIAGASEGKGKGHDFLRHLERTKALLYIVDAAGIDGRNPISDFEILMHELSAYGDGDMLNRRCLVVANKIDLLLKDEREEIYTRLQEKAEEAGIRMETNVIGISAGATGEGLPLLTKAIRDTVTSSEADKLKEEQYA